MAPNLLAQTLTNALGYQFESTFRYQFVLSPTKLKIPDFHHRRIGNRNLYTCPDLPVREIRSQSGDIVGLLLGYAVDKEGFLLGENITLQSTKEQADALVAFQELLAGLAGRHIGIMHLPGTRTVTRVFVDTTSSLSVVFDPTTKIVASSLLLCLNRDIEPNEYFGLPASVYTCSELSPFLPTRNPNLSEGGFNFGHTPDRYVKRILPNHYLDLNTFECIRYWPIAEIAPDLEVEESG